MTDWCILRTSPSRTLALAQALADAGFAVWTPIATTTRDALRAKEGLPPLPRGKGAVQITVPILTTFVFAGYDRVADLQRMADSPSLNYRTWDRAERRMVVRGRPHFTVFHLDGAAPRVPDRHLDALRQVEKIAAERAAKIRRRRGRRGRAAAKFAIGERVHVPEGPFAGLDGVIVPSVKNSSVRVEFCGGAIQAEIEPWLVQAIDIETAQPLAGSTAKAV